MTSPSTLRSHVMVTLHFRAPSSAEFPFSAPRIGLGDQRGVKGQGSHWKTDKLRERRGRRKKLIEGRRWRVINEAKGDLKQMIEHFGRRWNDEINASYIAAVKTFYPFVKNGSKKKHRTFLKMNDRTWLCGCWPVRSHRLNVTAGRLLAEK